MPLMFATNSRAGWGDAPRTQEDALQAKARAAEHVPHAPFYLPAWQREVATFHVPLQIRHSVRSKDGFPKALADQILYLVWHVQNFHKRP
ncbi:MAG: hypothetical protein IK079_06045 [Desulfovibrio sp.]|nr:hypothetical protein [Desulfovibrio sp.]